MWENPTNPTIFLKIIIKYSFNGSVECVFHLLPFFFVNFYRQSGQKKRQSGQSFLK